MKVQQIGDGTKQLTLDTDAIRKGIIFQLQALFEMAAQAAIDTSLKDWKQKENWSRGATYIAQTISSISETYDLKHIGEGVQDLAQLLSSINEDAKKIPLQQRIAQTEQELANLKKQLEQDPNALIEVDGEEAADAEETSS